MMAGQGPAPKSKNQRHSTRIPTRQDWVDLPELEKPILPKLPKLAGGEKWHPDVVRLWEAWRIDPVTQEWSPADIAYALETITIRQAAVPSAMSEVRLRMDALGLTPKGKRDLRWRLPNQTVDPLEREKQPGRAPRKARRRAHLMAVE